MDARGSALHQAFVGGFRPYLKEILDERGLPPVPEAIVAESERWLSEELAGLLALPYAAQRRSPLEILQEAMAGPNEALAETGVPAPLRDPAAVAALPGDRYGIAPASSATLGEEAFEAHLAWGMDKARALAPLVTGAGRRVVLVSGDLMDRSRFEDAVNGAGLQLTMWAPTGPGAETGAAVAFVDLTHPDADRSITALTQAGTRVIAYGPHVDSDAMTRAGVLGADTVLARSQLFRSIGDHLPRLT